MEHTIYRLRMTLLSKEPKDYDQSDYLVACEPEGYQPFPVLFEWIGTHADGSNETPQFSLVAKYRNQNHINGDDAQDDLAVHMAGNMERLRDKGADTQGAPFDLVFDPTLADEWEGWIAAFPKFLDRDGQHPDIEVQRAWNTLYPALVATREVGKLSERCGTDNPKAGRHDLAI